jgi:peptidoglycan hydrolase-like protein with peptidoglycan-binding domain
MVKKLVALLSLVIVAFVGVNVSAPVASAHGPAIIAYGQTGASVQCVQSGLNFVINAGLAVDGIFGRRTLQAVINYQRLERLAADGIVGPYTGGALIQDIYARGYGNIWVVSSGTYRGLACHRVNGTAFVGHY